MHSLILSHTCCDCTSSWLLTGRPATKIAFACWHGVVLGVLAGQSASLDTSLLSGLAPYMSLCVRHVYLHSSALSRKVSMLVICLLLVSE